MKKQFMLATFLTLMLFSLSASLLAQGKKKEEPTKELSAKDKAAFIEIFKSLPAQQYYLSFNTGGENYGTLVVPVVDVVRIRTGMAPVEPDKYIYKWVGSIGLTYVILPTRSGSNLESVLGTANAAKVEALVKKYTP